MSTELKTLNGYGFDATKLGGLDAQYYAQGRAAHNLLDNSNFRNPVNQRGKSSYSGITYTIDRWRSWDSNNITTLNDGSISVSVHIIQNIPKNRLKNGSTYTIALCASDGTIYVNSGVYTPDAEDFGDWTHTWVEITDSGDMAIYLRNGTYAWAALYEGAYTADTLPAYVPKDDELAECQRQYFPVFQSETTYAYWTKADGDTCKIYIPSPKMRVNPTPILYDGGCTIYLAGNSIWSNAVTLQYYGYAQGCNVFSFASPSDYFETGKTYLYRGIKALSAEM